MDEYVLQKFSQLTVEFLLLFLLLVVVESDMHGDADNNKKENTGISEQEPEKYTNSTTKFLKHGTISIICIPRPDQASHILLT